MATFLTTPIFRGRVTMMRPTKNPYDPSRIWTLADHFSKVMKERGQRVAVAESLTGGQLQSALTCYGGATQFFEGGVTTYSLDQKVNLLGVSRQVAEADDCVSSAVVAQMARGVHKLFGVDVSLATTGYADPLDDGEAPFFHYALYINDGTCEAMSTGRSVLRGRSRTERQQEAVCIVLEHAITFLEESQ